MADIHLTRLRKTYGKVEAIKDLSLDIRDGEFLVLLGPSGCGKTTTLRAIAGLETLDRGRILIGERDVTALPPGRRGIARVFQSYAVFPHMRVYDNIVFGLRMRHVPEADQRRRAQEAAMTLGSSRVQAFTRVALPMALPGLAAAAIFTFVLSWNEVFAATILTLSHRTLPALIIDSVLGAGAPLHFRFAGGFFMIVPALVIIFLIRRYLLTLWGVTVR